MVAQYVSAPIWVIFIANSYFDYAFVLRERRWDALIQCNCRQGQSNDCQNGFCVQVGFYAVAPLLIGQSIK